MSSPIITADPDAVFREALDRHRAGALNRARELYDRVIDISPDFADAWHLKGVASLQGGDAQSAFASITRAIAIDAERAEYHANLGTALQAMGQTDPAESAHRRAIGLRPDYADAHYNLANLLRDSHRSEEALEHYRAALAARPDFPEAYCNIGNLLFSLEQPEQAVASFERAVRLQPDLTEAHYNLGNCYLALEETDLARSAFEQALAVEPNHCDALVNLSQAFLRQRKFDQARECISRAISLQPSRARHYRLLGNTYIREGRPEEAIEPYRRAVALDPENGFGRHILNAITGETSTAAPEEYVRELFDACAGSFEKQLVERLQYAVPRQLRESIEQTVPERRFAATLDLGCGTGLMGEQIASDTDRLVGVDLSEKMIRQCRKKNLYDRLEVGQIEAIDRLVSERFDLIVAADVVIYLGDLERLFTAVKEVALPGAIFAFSTEQLDPSDGDFSLLPSGRYAHSRPYISNLCRQYGLTELDCREAMVRLEAGKKLTGDLYVMALPK